MRSKPKVSLLPCPASYARLLAEGWDSIQEVFNMNLSPAFVTMLEEAQLAARQTNSRKLEGLAEIELGGVAYRMHAKGTVGSRWVMEHDDFLIMIAAPGTSWPVQIRY